MTLLYLAKDYNTSLIIPMEILSSLADHALFTNLCNQGRPCRKLSKLYTMQRLPMNAATKCIGIA